MVEYISDRETLAKSIDTFIRMKLYGYPWFRGQVYNELSNAYALAFYIPVAAISVGVGVLVWNITNASRGWILICILAALTVPCFLIDKFSCYLAERHDGRKLEKILNGKDRFSAFRSMAIIIVSLLERKTDEKSIKRLEMYRKFLSENGKNSLNTGEIPDDIIEDAGWAAQTCSRELKEIDRKLTGKQHWIYD